MTRTNKTTAHTSQVYDPARQNFICLLRLTISKDSGDDSESNDSRTPRAGLRTSSVDREGIMNHIRSHTRRHEFSRGAVEGFLDFAQAIGLVLKSITYKEPSVSDVSESPTFSATPEIKLMSWKEWDAFDVAIPTNRPHCAIDVLIDEYHGPVGSNSIPLLQPGIHNEATARERGQHLNAGQDPLPTRIRINSGPAKRILGPILDARDNWRWRNAAPILVRPFKVLAAHSMEINDKMSEIERILAEKRKEQEVSEIVTDGGYNQATTPRIHLTTTKDPARETTMPAQSSSMPTERTSRKWRPSHREEQASREICTRIQVPTTWLNATCRLLRRLPATSAVW